MKNDSLKRFVDTNRQMFDDKQPSESIWHKILATLPGKQVSLWHSVVLWRAAAIVLLGVSIFQFVGRQGLPVNGNQQGEFRDVESYYAEQISEKTELIQREEFNVENSFAQDLEKLEAMYSVLSDEMRRRPSQKVKDALVLNMLVRIDLLNQLLQKVEESKRKERQAAV